MGGNLGDRFEAQPNALNLIRLLLASLVIVWHARTLLTPDELAWPVLQLLAQLPVDAFFAISGFLLVRSWHHKPQIRSYLANRAARLLPGLWMCLLVTGFVLAPAAAWLGGHQAPSLGGSATYVLSNLDLWAGQDGIDGGVFGDYRQGWSWNGSLWTLTWEAGCYLGVALLGVGGLLAARSARLVAAVCWALGALAVVAGLSNDDYGFLRMSIAGPRLVFMFAVGALFWYYRHRIPMTRTLAAVSVLLITVGAFTPSYRLIAAPAIAYLCLWAALELGRFPRLRLTHDISYGVYLYGWPVQTTLLAVGFTGGWAAFTAVSLAAVVPLAVVSWFAVERPVLRLRKRVTSRSRALAAATPAVSVVAATPVQPQP